MPLDRASAWFSMGSGNTGLRGKETLRCLEYFTKANNGRVIFISQTSLYDWGYHQCKFLNIARVQHSQYPLRIIIKAIMMIMLYNTYHMSGTCSKDFTQTSLNLYNSLVM